MNTIEQQLHLPLQLEEVSSHHDTYAMMTAWVGGKSFCLFLCVHSCVRSAACETPMPQHSAPRSEPATGRPRPSRAAEPATGRPRRGLPRQPGARVCLWSGGDGHTRALGMRAARACGRAWARACTYKFGADRVCRGSLLTVDSGSESVTY